MYGNRGLLHNDDLVLVRRHQVRRWLVCVLEFRAVVGRSCGRAVTTELFFLDEAVALAAGHRPCAECRYNRLSVVPNGVDSGSGLRAKPSADDIDFVLHGQRGLVGGVRTTHPAPLRGLPDGVFIVWRNEYWLLHNGNLHLWTPAGYTERRDLFDGTASVLTPRSTVDTIRADTGPECIDPPLSNTCVATTPTKGAGHGRPEIWERGDDRSGRTAPAQHHADPRRAT